jgi:hypothetical protein
MRSKFCLIYLFSFYSLFCYPQIQADESTNHLSSQEAIPLSSNDIPPKPSGYHLEDENFQFISDPFGNQIAVWTSHGIVYASIKPLEDNWQSTPDRLSSINELADDLHLSTDSSGNILVIWQTIPSLSIQSAVKCVDKPWQINALTLPDERGFDPQIAEGSTGYATAIWKCYDHEETNIELAEISLALTSPDEESDSTPDESIITDSDSEALIENTTLLTSLDKLSAMGLEELNYDDTIGQVWTHEQKESGDFLQDIGKLTRMKKSKSMRSKSSSSIIPTIPTESSTLPFPPIDLHGHQVKNRFVSQTDIVNIITWKAADMGPTAVAFEIFRSDLSQLAAIISAKSRLQFLDHNRRANQVDTYFIVAVDAAGAQSPPAEIVFKGGKTHVVTVVAPVAISIQPLNETIAVGNGQQFSATVTFSNGTVETLTSGVTWVSSNPAVATISSSGFAFGIASGTTTISGTIGGVTASTQLTVSGGNNNTDP